MTRLVTLPRQLRQNERAGAGRSDGQNGWGNTENRMSLKKTVRAVGGDGGGDEDSGGGEVVTKSIDVTMG